jgi:hypothetical protein
MGRKVNSMGYKDLNWISDPTYKHWCLAFKVQFGAGSDLGQHCHGFQVIRGEDVYLLLSYGG